MKKPVIIKQGMWDAPKGCPPSSVYVLREDSDWSYAPGFVLHRFDDGLFEIGVRTRPCAYFLWDRAYAASDVEYAFQQWLDLTDG